MLSFQSAFLGDVSGDAASRRCIPLEEFGKLVVFRQYGSRYFAI